MSRRRPDAWETEAMKKYANEFPPAARRARPARVRRAELSTHDNQRVTKSLNDALQAVLTGAQAGRSRAGRRPGASRPHPAATALASARSRASAPPACDDI